MRNAQTMPPTVSIGLFVYNGEKTLQKAIESLLEQTWSDFELIISDNASTDSTEEICRGLAARDSRIRYVRQARNIGASKNLQYVFDEATGEYFMWAAHDDIKSPEFLEINLQFLQKELDYVASTSPISFMGDMPNSIPMGDSTLDQDTAEERYLACLKTWYACGRFYSLFRRSALVGSEVLHGNNYIGDDIALMLELTIKGKFQRQEQGYVYLGRQGMSGSGNIFRMFRTSWKQWIMPMHEFGGAIWRQSLGFSTRGRIKLAGIIIKINLITFLHQFKIEILQWVQRMGR